MITETEIINKELIFIFPYRGIGGVSTLFMNTAEIISKEFNTKVSVVDYKDGYMSKNINLNNNLNLLLYSDDETLHLPSNSIAIFQAMTPWSIFPNLNYGENTRFLFWNLHPMNLIPMLPLFRWISEKNLFIGRLLSKTILSFYRKRILELLTYLINKNAIFFMDYTNLETAQSFLDYKVEKPKLLPIGIAGPKEFPEIYKIDDNTYKSGWLGRSTGFKNTILRKVLRDLDKIAETDSRRFIFYLISDSVDINLDLYKNLIFEIVDPIPPKELNKIMDFKLNTMFAMGTSAYESAIRGIPTVLLDFSYKEIPQSYLYNFIFEADIYSAGNFLLVTEVFNGSYMAEIVSRTTNEFGLTSNLSKEFTLANHYLPNLCKSILENITKSEADIKEMKEIGLLRSDMFYDALKKVR